MSESNLFGAQNLPSRRPAESIESVESAHRCCSVGCSWTRNVYSPRFSFGGWSTEVAGLAAVMHPAAAVGSDVEIGEGTVVMAGCVTNSGARVGRNEIVNTGATIEHDCEIADAVDIGPGRTCAVTLPSVWQR